MKVLYSLIIVLMLLFVACESNNTSVKYEHQNVQGVQIEDKFDFQKRLVYRNDRGATLNICISSQPDYKATIISCVLIAGRSIQSAFVFIKGEDDANMKTYLYNLVNNDIITAEEFNWLLEQVELIENKRKLIITSNAN